MKQNRNTPQNAKPQVTGTKETSHPAKRYKLSALPAQTPKPAKNAPSHQIGDTSRTPSDLRKRRHQTRTHPEALDRKSVV